MKIFMLLLATFLFSSSNENLNNVEKIINNTQKKFELVSDFEVKMRIDLKIPAFRMPKKKYKAYFKQPNKFKIKTKGFGVLPKTGIFTPPQENFNKLKNKVLLSSNIKDNVIISGELIADSLKLEFPNEYSKLTFKPQVEVLVDTIRWVIQNVTTKLDTLKLIEINNEFNEFNDGIFLPASTEVIYYVKDAKLANWLNKDINSMIGSQTDINSDMIKGTININYNNYKINIGLDDRIFD
ncbi:MAG: hypothetical protein CMF96_09180 [Candidatus Marinimicrobia bacterium]|nr:hypothetical protein [Candidatus Neomarinimicrobiota bacterium]|tara:strand:+ start:171 stop:887 length:717 start_codon:yes stop_codon:yes gene_type:complete